MYNVNPIITLSLDTIGYTCKPVDDYEIKQISNRIPQLSGDIDFDHFIEKIEQGHTFSPAVFIDRKRKKETWYGQSIICIDIDNPDGDVLSMPGFLDLCENYEIQKPAIIYH